MSHDKFVIRGFSGTSGVSNGRWTSAASSQANTTNNSGSRAQSGSSFVMGGGGLRPRPSATPRGPGRYSEHDSSQGEASGGGDRYGFNAERVRNKGTAHKYSGSPGCLGGQSLQEWSNTNRGNRIIVYIAMYGIGLFILIFCLIVIFGGSRNDDFYELPGTGKKARPLWANHNDR
jgi:hypothetical protein